MVGQKPKTPDEPFQEIKECIRLHQASARPLSWMTLEFLAADRY